MKKIYLSPSDQTENQYAYGKTNEAATCRKIALACKAALERCGFEAKTNTRDGSDAMYARVREANSWGADLYICIHTNAGGGCGAEAYVYKKTPERLAAAEPIYDEVRAISPYGSDRGIRKASFYELKHSDAVCVYLETDFHDDEVIARWLTENTAEIGEAICRGVCLYYGRQYLPAGESAKGKTTTLSMRILRRGDKGYEVKTLQRLLKQLGYTDDDGAALEVDGSFGPATEAAVNKYQRRCLGGCDGICGKLTWNELLRGE